MNCDCLEMIEREKDRFKKDREVRWAYLSDQASLLNFDTHETRTVTYSTVEVAEEGRKRNRKVRLEHNYCPFCGVRQDNMKVEEYIPGDYRKVKE